ncbi:MAG TPA: methionyl-tRNA formyltransferase, partial [Gemmatimonadales bacterium]|nr:methionyl-tRNA formyltransferase [Gemmatimonadales bacterium]
MRIVFFGTPAFAEASLRALLRAGHQVVGVVTQPDRPHGRSRSVLVPPPVKLLAEAEQLPVLQPERPTGDLFLAGLKRFDADLGVVVAYGHLLRQQVLDAPRLGMINVHASLLPRLRGAAPVQWAIARGDSKTGVSIMRMEAGLDSGPVLHQVATMIGEHETGGELTRRLASLGAEALVETLGRLPRHALGGQPQDDALATYAPKITRETARIDWTAGAAQVAQAIRAFDPIPGAWTRLGATELKLFGARPIDGTTPGEPGSIETGNGRLTIATGSGSVEIAEVQP